MTAFMRNDGFQAEIGWVGVAIEGFGVDDEQIVVGRGTHTKLCPAALAEDMPVLDLASK